MNILKIADQLSERLINIFETDKEKSKEVNEVNLVELSEELRTYRTQAAKPALVQTVKDSRFTEGGAPTGDAFASEDERAALSGEHPLLRAPLMWSYYVLLKFVELYFEVFPWRHWKGGRLVASDWLDWSGGQVAAPPCL